jgi:hypothetical protein
MIYYYLCIRLVIKIKDKLHRIQLDELLPFPILKQANIPAQIKMKLLRSLRRVSVFC